MAWPIWLGRSLGVVAICAAAVAAAISWNRAFQVDEVESIHAAYNVAQGSSIYRDFWQGHNPLLYLLLGSIVPFDSPELAFRLSRMACLVLFFSTVLMSDRVSRRLGGIPGLTAALLVLHTTFVERGLEVRPDTLMTTLVMAAIFVGSSKSRTLLASFVLQGLLLGLAFVATQKAAIAACAFGLSWLSMSVVRRDWRIVVVPCLVWVLPVAVMMIGLAAAGSLEAYVMYNLSHPAESIGGGGAASAGFSAIGPLLSEGLRNPAFILLGIACIVATSLGVFRREREWVDAQVVLLAGVWIGGLFLMRFPYPYSHVGGLPAFAVLIGAGLPALAGRFAPGRDAQEGVPREGWPAWVAVAVLGLIGVQAATAMPRLVGEIGRGNDYQLHLVERVDALTDDGDPVFDLAGLYLRSDAYPVYLMTGAHYVRYQNGDYPSISETLRENGLSVFLVNYRLRWLTGEDREFLQGNFVRVEPNIFMSGAALDAFEAGVTRFFEVTRKDEYRFDGEGELRVDGAPFSRGVLERGVHALTSPSGIERGRLVLSKAPAFAPDLSRDYPVYYAFD